MRTEAPTGARTARAAIQLNLTAAGWAVVAMMVAAVFLSSSSRLAVGFLIPLGAALAIDVYLSWHVVSRRSVSIAPARTVVYMPDGLPLRITTRGPAHPVRLTVTFRGGVDQVVGVTEGFEVIDLPAKNTGAVDYVRCNITSTVFGLGTANRWETHSVAPLHWAPAPDTSRIPTPSAIDEVARLRAYVPGDRMSRVSWPVTARTGQMHVRAAGEGHEEYTVIVNLGPTHGSAGENAIVDTVVPTTDSLNTASQPNVEVLEATLRLASTLISQLLEDGHQVRLVTTELTAEVRDILRRAAVANPRLPAIVPEGTVMETQFVDRFVTDDDDAARRLALAEIAAPIAWSYGPYVEVSMLGVRSLP